MDIGVLTICQNKPVGTSVHTGLTILDRLPKKKTNTLKVTKLTSCMDFRMIQAVIKCFERSTVERIGHFRVLLCLCFKTSLSAKPFI